MEWHYYTNTTNLRSILECGEIRSNMEITKALLKKDNPPKKVEEKLRLFLDRYDGKEFRRRSFTSLINEKRAVDCLSDDVCITIEEDIQPNYGSHMLKVPKISIDNLVEIGAKKNLVQRVQSIVKENEDYSHIEVYSLD